MSSVRASMLAVCLLTSVGCADFEHLSEECKTKNAVRRVSAEEPWAPPTDTRTALAMLAASPDLPVRISLASNTAGLQEQLLQVQVVPWLIEAPAADADERLVATFQEVEAAAPGAWRTTATATALAFILHERKVKAAVGPLARALERRLHAPAGVPLTFFLMVQNALWELLGRPALPPGGLVHERVFLIEAAGR